MQEPKILILEELAKNWSSARRISESNAALADRNTTSLLLHSMSNDGFIKKCTNGYWQITELGREHLQNNGDKKPLELAEDLAEQIAEEFATDGGALGGGVIIGPNQNPLVDLKPDPFDALRVLAELVPSNAMFSIGKDSIILGSKKYRIEKPGDFEAVMRAEALVI